MIFFIFFLFLYQFECNCIIFRKCDNSVSNSSLYNTYAKKSLNDYLIQPGSVLRKQKTLKSKSILIQMN